MRDWKFSIDDWVAINEKATKVLPNRVGTLGKVFELLPIGVYDYRLKFSDGSIASVLESELNTIEKEHLQLYLEFEDGFFEVLYNNKRVMLVQVDLLHKQVEIMHQDNSMEVVSIDKVKRIEGEIMVEKEESKLGKFGQIALELGNFTDMKNKQYGSSVDATYEMIKVLMERYKNEDDTYTIPQSLLQHILLQVRMMDKINRIFNNPSGKGDSESPYRDLTGYSLIGVDMVEK